MSRNSRRLRTAANPADAAQVVQITHPFHPWFGRSFEVVTTQSAWGEDRVFVQEKGRLCGLPVSWTDAAPADPFVVVAAFRSLWRTEDLVRLTELVQCKQR